MINYSNYRLKKRVHLGSRTYIGNHLVEDVVNELLPTT